MSSSTASTVSPKISMSTMSTVSPTINPSSTSGWPSSAHVGAVPSSAPQSTQDELVRIFNTALISTQAEPSRDFTSEIYELMETPAFRAILSAVRQYSRLQGLSERQAAEQVISTFRRMDQVWRDYVFQEGVDRIKNAT